MILVPSNHQEIFGFGVPETPQVSVIVLLRNTTARSTKSMIFGSPNYKKESIIIHI